MKIVEARTIVVGTPWRELVFLELATDNGLVGTSQVRMVNKTSKAGNSGSLKYEVRSLKSEV